MRPAPGKVKGIILDIAGNTWRFGIPDFIEKYELDFSQLTGLGTPPFKTCESCGLLNFISAKFCKNCDTEFPVLEKKPVDRSLDLYHKGDLVQEHHIDPLSAVMPVESIRFSQNEFTRVREEYSGKALCDSESLLEEYLFNGAKNALKGRQKRFLKWLLPHQCYVSDFQHGCTPAVKDRLVALIKQRLSDRDIVSVIALDVMMRNAFGETRKLHLPYSVRHLESSWIEGCYHAAEARVRKISLAKYKAALKSDQSGQKPVPKGWVPSPLKIMKR